MEFTIDFGNALAGAAVDTGPLYAAVEGTAFDLGGDECVFRRRDDGEAHVMTHQVLAALDQCRPFRSLDAHARIVAQRVAGLAGREDAVRPVLDNLVARGLLRAEAEVLAGLSAGAAAAPAPFDALYVRACDRPAHLEALLGSIASAARRFGGAWPVVVLDDSRGADAVRANAAAIAGAARAGLAVRHVAPERGEAALDALARDRPALAATWRYALGRRPAGRNSGGRGYHLALLLAQGRRFGLLDEDFRFDFRRAGEARLDLVAGAEPQARFFATIDDALAAGSALDADPVATQLAWCGVSLAAALAATPSWRPAPGALAGLELGALAATTGAAHVIATCNGHRGSAGTAGSEWMFLLDAEDRAAFAAERDRYLGHLDAGSVWLGYRRPRLLREGVFTPFLLDGGVLLPPTRPEGRSEDQLFGQLCRAAHPDSVVLHTDWAIAHVQETARMRSDSLRRPDTPGLSQFLADFIAHRRGELRAADPGDRLATLAQLLGDLARAPRAARADLLREYLAFRRADLVARLQRAFHAAGDAPIWWQADVRELIAANGRALTEPAPPRLAETPADADADAAADWLAREIEPFAALLAAWPAMRERARELLPGLVLPR